MEYLTQFMVIASFVGGKPPEHMLQHWLNHLQHHISGTLILGRNLGKGFFLIKTGHTDTMKQLLLLTPYRSPAGLCIFQRWAPGFDPNADRGLASPTGKTFGMKIPIWITLHYLPDKFCGIASQIATSLGELLGTDTSNSESIDPRFCVAIDSGLDWEPSVVVNNKHIQLKTLEEWCVHLDL
jgi:hypothetical protein